VADIDHRSRGFSEVSRYSWRRGAARRHLREHLSFLVLAFSLLVLDGQ
jgi:hypothetical protein